MRKFIQNLALVAAVFGAIGATAAYAQEWTYQPPSAPPPAVPEDRQEVDASAASGPTIYVVDKYRQLATINLGTKIVHIIGIMGPSLTDIGFNPKNHRLYGLSFSAFYLLNTSTAATQLVGGLGVTDANALVFNSAGVAYSAGVNTGDLYKIDTHTGRASVVGSTGGYGSAGDLIFYNKELILSGFKGIRNISPSTPNYLVTLNEKTGAHIGNPILMPVKELFGLVSTGTNLLYGLALDGNDAGLYQLFPSASTTSKRAVLLEDLTTHGGLGQIYGAAYDGNYQP